MTRKEQYVKKIVQCIIDNDPDVDISCFDEYCIKAALNGVKVSFDDPNFCIFAVMKAIQDKDANDSLYETVMKALMSVKFLDLMNDRISDIIQDKMVDLVMNDKDAFCDMFDYMFKKFPEAKCTKKIAHLAYGTGRVSINIGFHDLVKYVSKHPLEEFKQIQKII